VENHQTQSAKPAKAPQTKERSTKDVELEIAEEKLRFTKHLNQAAEALLVYSKVIDAHATLITHDMQRKAEDITTLSDSKHELMAMVVTAKTKKELEVLTAKMELLARINGIQVR